MKTIFSILLIIFIFNFFMQCSSLKKKSDSDGIAESIEHSRANGSKFNNHDLLIHCGKDSAIYNVTNNSLTPNNISIYYCLNEKAFKGDTNSIRQVSLLIDKSSNSLEFFKKPRGKILFKAVLERVKNFEFIPGPNGEMDFYTYYGRYVRVLSGMIESIDGISPYEYINKHVYTIGKSELEAEELFSPRYIQILARISWETYNEAYDKGLIKLKDFGQE